MRPYSVLLIAASFASLASTACTGASAAIDPPPRARAGGAADARLLDAVVPDALSLDAAPVDAPVVDVAPTDGAEADAATDAGPGDARLLPLSDGGMVLPDAALPFGHGFGYRAGDELRRATTTSRWPAEPSPPGAAARR
jgi:hypothetical protein